MSNEQDNKMIITRKEYDNLKDEISQLRCRGQIDGGDKFWLYCWAIICTGVLGLITVLTVHSYSKDKLFADIITKSPENAMAIACAQDATTSQTTSACTIYLSKLK